MKSVPYLSTTAAAERLKRGERLHMQLLDGKREWWFEAPLARVSDAKVAGLLFGHAPSARVMEAGDSLFGLPMNSQTWLPCAEGEH